jgi:hypothetical protein
MSSSSSSSLSSSSASSSSAPAIPLTRTSKGKERATDASGDGGVGDVYYSDDFADCGDGDGDGDGDDDDMIQSHVQVWHGAKLIVGYEIDEALIDWTSLAPDAADRDMYASMGGADWDVRDDFLEALVDERYKRVRYLSTRPYVECGENRRQFITLGGAAQELEIDAELVPRLRPDGDARKEFRSVMLALGQDAKRKIAVFAVPHIESVDLGNLADERCLGERPVSSLI